MILKDGIEAVFFDLDGTLAHFDYDEFANLYFTKIGQKAATLGLDPKAAVKYVWDATKLTFMNDGSRNNDEVFWDKFTELIAQDGKPFRKEFDKFYETEFDTIKSVTTPNPYARKLIDLLLEKGIKIIVATNPVFPRTANLKRLGWVDLKGEDFIHITSYENSSYCKPNPKYYGEILEKCGLKAENCIMIGNDVAEDMAAKKAGLDVYLVTDCLINKNNEDISGYRKSSFKELYDSIAAE